MWMLPSSVKIYVASEPTDLRRGFDGLAAATRSVIGQSPLSGHLFVFVNRRRNRVKILSWDRTGYVLLYKRLERGSFELRTSPRPGSRHVELDSGELGTDAGGVGSSWSPPPEAVVSESGSSQRRGARLSRSIFLKKAKEKGCVVAVKRVALVCPI